ncbi:MAG: LemA family protein, partial [Knoellia sp.]
YNATVRDLNTKVETVPTNFVAGIFSIKTAEYFEAVGEQREAPKVDFGQRDTTIPPPSAYAAPSPSASTPPAPASPATTPAAPVDPTTRIAQTQSIEPTAPIDPANPGDVPPAPPAPRV